MSNPNFLLNGQPSKQVSILDRGLHYGDGLFETIAVNEGQTLLWQAHMQRLKEGCERLKIPFPDTKILQKEAKQLIPDNCKSVLKIMLTRGEAGRGYKPATSLEASRILAVYDWPEHPREIRSEGVNVRICETQIGWNPTLAGIKHMNRLEQVLARSEWNDDKIFEGLILDIEGNVIEGCMSNVFVINDNKISTPDLTQCGIDGIVRDLVLEIAADFDLKAEVKKLSMEDILAAEEVFLTNSIIGLVPVKQIETCCFNSFMQTQKLSNYLLNERLIAPL